MYGNGSFTEAIVRDRIGEAQRAVSHHRLAKAAEAESDSRDAKHSRRRSWLRPQRAPAS